jgi:hypothetical protein
MTPIRPMQRLARTHLAQLLPAIDVSRSLPPKRSVPDNGLFAAKKVEPTDVKSNRSARLPGGRMSLDQAK